MSSFLIDSGVATAGYLAFVGVGVALLPAVPFWPTMAGFAVVWGLALCAYSRMAWRGRAATVVLAVAALVMSALIILNLYSFTTLSGGTVSDPQGFYNPDCARDWASAMYVAGYAPWAEAELNFMSYTLVLAGLMQLFGPNVVFPLQLNMLAMMLCFVFSGEIGVRVLSGQVKWRLTTIAAAAAATTAAVCAYTHCGVILMKDAFVCLGIAMAAAGLLRERPVSVLTIAGILLLVYMRPNYAFVCMVGVLIMCCGMSRRQLWQAAVLCCVCVAAWAFFRYFGFGQEVGKLVIDKYESNSGVSYQEQNLRAWYNIIGEYGMLPIWKRLMWMPLSAVVQFIMPLPCNVGKYLPMSIPQAYLRMGYAWFLVGGLVVYYVCAAIRRSPGMLRRLTLWGLFAWMVPVYLFAGTVARYALPFVPLLVPSALYVVANYWRHRSLRFWGVVYLAMMAIGLAIAYNMYYANQ